MTYPYPSPSEEVIHLLPCSICSTPFDPCTLPSHFYDPYNAFSFPHRPLESTICPSCFAEELARRAPMQRSPTDTRSRAGSTTTATTGTATTGTVTTAAELQRPRTAAGSRPSSRNVLRETPASAPGSRPGSSRALSRQTSRSRELLLRDKSKVSTEMLREVSERADSAAAFVHGSGGEPKTLVRKTSTLSKQRGILKNDNSSHNHSRSMDQLRQFGQNRTLSHSHSRSVDQLRLMNHNQTSSHSHGHTRSIDLVRQQVRNHDFQHTSSHSVDPMRPKSPARVSGFSVPRNFDQERPLSPSGYSNYSLPRSVDLARQEVHRMNSNHSNSRSADQLRQRSLAEAHSYSQSASSSRRPSRSHTPTQGSSRSIEHLRQGNSHQKSSHSRAQSHDLIRQKTPTQTSPHTRAQSHDLIRQDYSTPKRSFEQIRTLAQQQQQQYQQQIYRQHQSMEQLRQYGTATPTLEKTDAQSERGTVLNPQDEPPSPRRTLLNSRSDLTRKSSQKSEHTVLRKKNSLRQSPKHRQVPQHPQPILTYPPPPSSRRAKKEARSQEKAIRQHHRAEAQRARHERSMLSRGISLPLFCPSCCTVVRTAPAYVTGSCCIWSALCLAACCPPLCFCVIIPWRGAREVMDVEGVCPECGGILCKWSRRRNALEVYTWVGVGEDERIRVVGTGRMRR